MWFIAGLCGLTIASGKIRGIHPQNEKILNSPSFSCLDASNSNAVLNDDYCDCKDGSDEPSTNACYNGTFYCINDGHVPAVIQSRQVDDKYCDPQCCDGSDEKDGYCPNVCIQQAIKEKAEKSEGERIRKLGAQAKIQMIEKANQLKREKTEELLVLQRSLGDLIAKSKLADKQVEAIEKESQTSSKPVGGGGGFDGLIKTISDAFKGLFGSDGGGKEEAPKQEKVPEECDAECESAKKAKQEEADKKLMDAQAAQTNAKAELTSQEEKIKSLKEELTGQNGPDDVYLALRNTCLSMDEGEYTYEFCYFGGIKQGYTILGRFDQSQWQINDGHMVFTNGDACWNGPIRMTKVQLECSEKEQILSIAEPNMCEYFMRIGSSAFCTILPEDRQELHTEL